MPRTLEQLLDAAFKSLTTVTLGDSILVAEQFDRFVQALEARAPLLRDSRLIVMQSHTTNIDRWTLGQVLGPPADEGETFTGETTPDTFTNVLHATKVRGRVKASDEALMDALSGGRNGGSTADQLTDLIGARAGVDLERLFIQGDVTSGDPYLALLDGWLVRAEHAVTGVEDADFDSADVEDMFETMLAVLDGRFLVQRDRMRFWVPWHIENDYRNVLRTRGTELADRAQIGDGPLAYKGIRIQETPGMPDGAALLAHRDNVVHGIWKDIEIEDERVAGADRHDFHVRARGDANYEDEEGAVAADGYTGP